MNKYLEQKEFKKGIVDKNLYVKFECDHILIVVVYVDDIIFGSGMEQFGCQFAKCMQTEFELSMIKELSFI